MVSFSHINVTHRNWTAVGLSDLALCPIIDPRGLVTPFYDGWSLDFWLIGPNNRWLVPAALEGAEQRLDIAEKPARRLGRLQAEEDNSRILLKRIEVEWALVAKKSRRGHQGVDRR